MSEYTREEILKLIGGQSDQAMAQFDKLSDAH